MSVFKGEGSKSWNFTPCHIGFENSLEQMQMEKVRRVRIRRGYRMNSCIVPERKVRRVRILRIYNLVRIQGGKVRRVRILNLTT